MLEQAGDHVGDYVQRHRLGGCFPSCEPARKRRGHGQLGCVRGGRVRGHHRCRLGRRGRLGDHERLGSGGGAARRQFFFSNFVRGAAGPGDILKYTPGRNCETWVSNVGCNGLTAAYDGRLVGVCQGSRAVMAFDVATKQSTILAGMYLGKLLDSPNDVAAHSNGSIYFSNPTYELGNRPVGVGPAVFYVDRTGVLNLIKTVNNAQPNGIAISPDEKTLYVEIDGSGVKTYDLDADGAPSNGPKNFTQTLSSSAVIGPTGTRVVRSPAARWRRSAERMARRLSSSVPASGFTRCR
jgi:hypothetical protein